MTTGTINGKPALVNGRQFMNDRTGERITVELSNAEAALKFAELAKDSHWIWFHLHKFVKENTAPKELQEALERVGHLFLLSIGYGLKRPKIRVVFKDKRYKLYLSNKGTLCIKAGARYENTDRFHEEEYVGCVYQGRFLKNRDRNVRPDELEFLDRLAAEHVDFLAECSKDMGTCCYCNKPLEDPDSKKVGYGPICAKRWGLPWGKQVYWEKAPNFMRSYDFTAQGLCERIQDEPRNEMCWAMFSEWLQEQGLSPVEMPSHTVVLPLR